MPDPAVPEAPRVEEKPLTAQRQRAEAVLQSFGIGPNYRLTYTEAVNAMQLFARDEVRAAPGAAAVSRADPCSLCGGPCPFDTSVPSVRWNAVIRANELPEWLCATCILREFATRGESFTAVLSGEGVSGTTIEVRVNGQAAKDAELIQEENNKLRWRVRELEEPPAAVSPLADIQQRAIKILREFMRQERVTRATYTTDVGLATAADHALALLREVDTS